MTEQIASSERINEKLAELVRERRDTVSKIIRKLQASEQDDTLAVSGSNQETRIQDILAGITTFEDVLKWAKNNFESSDILLLETKFKQKLELHPERKHDENYCRLLALIFYLFAANQCARVYGDFSHRAISDAFSTHLDKYHTLHLLEIACHFADVTIEVYILKAIIAGALTTQQDYPFAQEQQVALAKLCLFPEDGVPLGDEGLPVELRFAVEETSLTTDKRETPKKANLSTIQKAINNVKKAKPGLIQRHELQVWTEQNTKAMVPYYAPDLALCLQLRKVITVPDIKKSNAPFLLNKLAELWEILLPLHIDIGEMEDFR